MRIFLRRTDLHIVILFEKCLCVMWVNVFMCVHMCVSVHVYVGVYVRVCMHVETRN